ncbi:hypothetical protein [Tunicatimonas pelagia]|uniref:hypothetical protein n=1 Tax=Tunicatimonas pelagia TaxID=931531 RepID=UPI002665AA93|nr:hypothetical protein [Tunicatimonas pelagia]WKN46032.1 hypothetical protein P0M28_13840 [Tunicatimonas pelagia]
MEPLDTLDKKLKDLPEEAHLELLEYVDYLSYKYADRSEDKSNYDELLEELLTNRYKTYQQNPDSASSSEEFRHRINKKFGWNE